MTRIDRREFLRRTALLSASTALIMAGCQTGAPASSAGPGTATAAASITPKRGGTLTWGQSLVNDELDPALSGAGGGQEIVSQIYDTLVALADDYSVVPRLAARWTVDDGGRKFTFMLRDDVRFHDGTLLDANAVKASWERVLDPTTKSPNVAQFGPIASIDAPDPRTVIVNYKQPYPPLLIQAWRTSFAIVSPKVLASLKKGDKITTPVGSGPFKYAGRSADGVVTLEPFADYVWGPSTRSNRGAPFLQQVKLRVITEPGTRVATLESGESLFVDEVPEGDYQRLKADTRFRFTTIPVPGTPLGFYFNVKKPPLDDQSVRDAINFAVDRQAILDKVFFGIGKVEMSIAGHGVAGRLDDFDNKYPFDPAKSRQLLDAAGWQTGADGIRAKAGQRLSLILATYRPAWGQIAQVLQSQLRTVGIDVQIQSTPQPAYLDFVRRYQHHMAETAGAVGDFGQLFNRYHSSQIAITNYVNLADPTLDGLLDKGNQQQIGSPERKQTYDDAQRRLMGVTPGVFVLAQVKIQGYAAKVRGFRGFGPEPQWGANLCDVWLES